MVRASPLRLWRVRLGLSRNHAPHARRLPAGNLDGILSGSIKFLSVMGAQLSVGGGATADCRNHLLSARSGNRGSIASITVAQGHEKRAEELEAEALANPGERDGILLDAAHAWHLAGNHDRARAILTELIEQRGVYHCDARSNLAYLHMVVGDDELAYAELELLAKESALALRQCVLAAELVGQYGSSEDAMVWYDRAVTHLSDEHLSNVNDRDDPEAVSINNMLFGRWELRREIGRHPDTFDLLVSGEYQHPSVHDGTGSTTVSPTDRPGS
jgi:hypothetical protein